MAPLKLRARWRAWRHRIHFYSERGYGRHLGRFATFEEALSTLPPSQGFDHDGFWDHYIAERSRRVYAFDYPMMFWLRAAYDAGARSILDVGGSIGVHYYAYGRYGVVPGDMTWLVCELPETVRVGARLATAQGAQSLRFETGLDTIVPEQDVWIFAGILEFLPVTMLPGLFSRASTPPAHILINKIPLHEGPTFVSTQNLGKGNYAPHYVFNREEFTRAIEYFGYQLIDVWDVPERTMELPGAQCFELESYAGLYFRRGKAAAEPLSPGSPSGLDQVLAG